MILITSGEPSGIGPDIVLKLTQNPEKISTPWVVLGDMSLFKDRAKQLNIPVNMREYHPELKPLESSVISNSSQNITLEKNTLWVWHIPLKAPVSPGILNKKNSAYVLEQLNAATKACCDFPMNPKNLESSAGLTGVGATGSRPFNALVTAPIHKAIIAENFPNFSGHTEYFAQLTHTPEVVMMLASDELRVALVTTHLPLREVPDAITQEKIIKVITIIHHDFQKYFTLKQPCIYVCGLNPHAGENGHLGREEIDVIIPALNKIRENKIGENNTNICVEGPFPADSLFTKAYLNKADVFLAMYHDQGLSVLKYAAFDNAVNITLGLPFIRTSVDHGTALDLAGTGKASENSLIRAVQMAERMYNKNQ